MSLCLILAWRIWKYLRELGVVVGINIKAVFLGENCF